MKKNIFLFCVIIIPIFSFSQENKLSYLTNNKNNFSIESGFSFNSNIEKCSIFLAGEIHYYKNNGLISLELLKEMYNKFNVRYFVFEMPDFDVMQINDYLQNGGEIRLKNITNDSSFGINFINDKILFYKGLKSFYDLQPTNEKLKLFGIDVICNKYEAIDALVSLIPSGYLSSNELFDELKYYNSARFSTRKAEKILKKANLIINQDSVLYKKLLKNNFNVFKTVLKGSLIGLKMGNRNRAKDLEDREQFMYENFKNLIEENPEASFFAQIGRAHIPITYQKRWIHLFEWNSLAARLNTNDDSPVKGKVCSIAYYYSSHMEYENRGWVEPIIKNEDLPLFLKYSTTPLTLFKLDGKDTPFKEMAEKFQYIIINKY